MAKRLRLNAVSKISQIQELPKFPSRDVTSYRVHHVLTNIASDVLPYIMIEDDKIREIDLMNSQLTLFCNIIYRSISSNNTIHLPKIIEYLFTQSLGWDWHDNTISMYHQKRWDRHTVYLCSDLELDPNSVTLIKSAFSGKFYECVGQLIYQVDHLSDRQRKDVKLTMFNLLFGSVIHSETLQNSIKFRKVFPAFYFLIFYLKMFFGFLYESKDPMLKYINLDIDLLKRDKPKITGMKAGSNLLSILLQRFESTIFIDRILVTLYEMGCKVLPKHDSVICTSRDYEEVNSIIQSELDRKLGKGMYNLR